jgi:hypothetical protein
VAWVRKRTIPIERPTEVRVRFPALPDFLGSSESGTGSTQPREYNWGAASKKKSSGWGIESQVYGRRDPSRWQRGTLYPQKLALTSQTSGGRSVGRKMENRLKKENLQAGRTRNLKWCGETKNILQNKENFMIWLERKWGQSQVGVALCATPYQLILRSHRSKGE